MKALIIGGGIMGTSIALDLVNAGLEVTVLERAIPGAEASSAAAGMLAPQLEAHAPGAFLDLCLRSRGLYPKWVKQLESSAGIQVDYLESGALQVALNEDELHALEATVAWQKASSLRAELLTGTELQTAEPSISGALGAAQFKDDHQVEPKKLMTALSMAVARAGATFRTGNVRSLISEAGRCVGVDVEGEELRADVVVLAAGSWSSLVAGAKIDTRHVKPAKGQLVELKTRLPVLKHVIKAAGGYLVPRADGRVIVGSTLEFVGFDKAPTAGALAKLLQMAVSLVPVLKDAQVGDVWAGLRPYTEDALPILGEGPLPGLVLATGHFRNGILLAPITARLISQLIRGESPSVSLQPFRYLRFPQ